MIRILIGLFVLLFPLPLSAESFEVHASGATDLPIQKSDIMDDPAIWVNESQPSESLILATNKKPPYGGLYVYGLDGKLQNSLQIGPINNVDIRKDFSMAHTFIDIAVASYKPEKRLAFFGIAPTTGKVTFLGLGDKIFEKRPCGVCLQKEGQDFYVIVTFKFSGAEKWKFWAEDDSLLMKKVVSYPIKTLAEGCVVDDSTGTVFIGEEDVGIWAFPKDTPGKLIAQVGENGLTADVEGLTLYGNKYLIASSQGNSSYNIYRPSPPYSFISSFKIAAGSYEGTEDTDGIDVTSANLGGIYTDGLFVAHDNRSSKGGGSNFKVVPWREIQRGLNE